MNERIKELALLSGFDIDTNVSFAEKTRLKCFAELIVQECLAIAKNREDELENANLIEESNAVGNVAYRISRQFGVNR